MSNWPPDYKSVLLFRQERLLEFKKDFKLIFGAKEYYKNNPVDFICHWVDTLDPRNAGKEDKLAVMPFCLFERQKELVLFLHQLVLSGKDGLVEKARDMGATWVCCAFSVWLWLFLEGSSIGWGSRKELLVDKLGNPDSIFEKLRFIVNRLPKCFLPKGFVEKEHMTFMRILNPENGSNIKGEAGDNIGRGGRSLIFFKDESAHYERPEKIEAALTNNTDTQIDISSVNGLGNVFHKRREGGKEWNVNTGVFDGVNVFVMDWSSHPNKDLDWYVKSKETAERNGNSHIFAQEIDRNYSASITGLLIPADWVKSAIDAHEKLEFDNSETYIGGLDVSDGGQDKNAFALRKGDVLVSLSEWTTPDTGVLTRQVVEECKKYSRISVQYDSVGVGSGVKSEYNRLVNDKRFNIKALDFVEWNAGSNPQFKDKRMVDNDVGSPLIKDVFANLKAQGWWMLRRRFEKTHKMINKEDSYPLDELISISSKISNLHSLIKELSQPTFSHDSKLRMLVDKAPQGTRSPNLADAVMMAFWPITQSKIKVIRKPKVLVNY